MCEIKIAERIMVDEPQNVELAIKNLTGQMVDFEIIKKFILNEKNTIFYLDKKLNSSTEYGQYTDYVWLDTGFRDARNQPIMICLHNGYDGFTGHYTGTIRILANRVKNFNGKNTRDIEKNFSRFLSKYATKAKERLNESIIGVNDYALAAVNREFPGEFALEQAISKLDIEFAPDEIQEELVVEEVECEEMSLEQREMTIGMLYDMTVKLQEENKELIERLEKYEQESQEEIAFLKAKNKEYEEALVTTRLYMEREALTNNKEDAGEMTGHALLGRKKILILGNTDIREVEMCAIARDYFGFQKDDFEFVTDYKKIKNDGERIHRSQRFAAIIFGNCPHKVAGIGKHASIIDEYKQYENCSIAVDARTEAGGLKITKQSFKRALMEVVNGLRSMQDEAA